ncbi:major facilitator superfamily domain-containing protein [Cercophora newfieldiana]|uniref:Major facilitator superfamily domain-containing protein n=1 Tax=Cercophora newfieldiana TaxID=92897 RepID=A0AA40CUH4_9PEZI|nr:major facilitator superfamily domain-containing protein [Cercophora newfieldiana]
MAPQPQHENGNRDGHGHLETIEPMPEETTPLLDERDENASRPSPSPLYPYALIFVVLLIIVSDVGGSLLDTPEVRLLEMAVCRDYYRLHDPSVIGPPPLSYVDENLCKERDIQTSLVYLRTKKGLLGLIPGILLTIPYGRLSDRHGRKPILFLGILGQVLSYFWMLFICYFHQTFDTRLVLISPAFLLIGGGSRVLSAAVYSVIVDVTPEEMRTTAFYVLGAGAIICDVIMAPIGSWLLAKDLWLPFRFSSIILLFAVLMTLMIPETLPVEKRASSLEIPESPPTTNADPERQNIWQWSFNSLRDYVNSITSALGIAWATRELRLCLLVVFLFTFNVSSGVISISYASTALDWPVWRVGYLISVNGMMTLGILIALAFLSQALERRLGVRPLALDVNVVRVSSIVLGVAGLLMGLPYKWTIIIGYILSGGGYGLYQAMQGLLASYGDKTHTGQVYATASLVDLVARMAGALTYSRLFEWGWDHFPWWGKGLPFLVVSLFNFLLSLVAFWLPTKVPTRA